MNAQLKTTAEALVGHCRAHTEAQGLDTLYAKDAVSVEAFDISGPDTATTHGVAAIKGKHEWWAANFDVSNEVVGDPMYHGNDRFSVIFESDVTNKDSKERSHMQEVAIYTVNDAGKITREEFFYATR